MDALEVHGVNPAQGKSLTTITEYASTVRLDLHTYSSVSLTPAEARYLASKLYRLARRIEQRTRGAA